MLLISIDVSSQHDNHTFDKNYIQQFIKEKPIWRNYGMYIFVALEEYDKLVNS